MESIDTSHNGGPGAVLWDLDGTLIDSAGLHWFAWHEVMAEEGHSITPRQFADSFGKRNDTILRGLLGPDLTDDWIRRVSDAKEERYRRYVRERGLEFLPGAATWLAQLRDTGWKQVLASSAPPANIDSALEALDLGRWLDGLVSAEEVGVGKPDPAIFLRAAERVAVPPARCIVVEDAPAGLEGARRAGMKSVGVLSSHFPELVADWVVPSLEALPADAFQSLLKRA
jgi:HAD superfamily hydrolase (TIGR01509 family)